MRGIKRGWIAQKKTTKSIRREERIMVIYFVLISLMSAQIAISEGMRRKISQEMAERNSKSGFDTSGTIASEEVRKKNHKAAVVCLKIDSICGIVGVVASLVLLIVTGFSWILMAVPLLILVVQIAMAVAALTAANDVVAKA